MQMTEVGTFHYWSGFMVEDYSMRGTIEVVEAEKDDDCKHLNIRYGEILAEHVLTPGTLAFV